MFVILDCNGPLGEVKFVSILVQWKIKCVSLFFSVEISVFFIRFCFQPGEVWMSNCNLCTCNNKTRTQECTPRPPRIPECSSDAVLVNTSCCGDQICGEHSSWLIFLQDNSFPNPYTCLTFSAQIYYFVISQLRGPADITEQHTRYAVAALRTLSFILLTGKLSLDSYFIRKWKVFSFSGYLLLGV